MSSVLHNPEIFPVDQSDFSQQKEAIESLVMNISYPFNLRIYVIQRIFQEYRSKILGHLDMINESYSNNFTNEVMGLSTLVKDSKEFHHQLEEIHNNTLCHLYALALENPNPRFINRYAVPDLLLDIDIPLDEE